MSNPDCLHCMVRELLKSNKEKFTLQDVILRLSEVIADHIMLIDDHKGRADAYEYWGNIMLEMMREIESGEYK